MAHFAIVLVLNAAGEPDGLLGVHCSMPFAAACGLQRVVHVMVVIVVIFAAISVALTTSHGEMPSPQACGGCVRCLSALRLTTLQRARDK